MESPAGVTNCCLSGMCRQGGIGPDEDVGDVLEDGGVFSDQLFSLTVEVLSIRLGALVGDVPGLGEVVTAGAEAEGEEALVRGLIVAGVRTVRWSALGVVHLQRAPR